MIDMCNALEELRQEGYQEGYRRGYQEGRQEERLHSIQVVIHLRRKTPMLASGMKAV